MLNETVDVAFVRPLLGDRPDLVSESLFDEDMLIALPQGHPLARFRTLRLGAGIGSLAFRVPSTQVLRRNHRGCQRNGFSPRVVQEASQVTSIVNLVAAGLGVSLVPASMQQINSEGVVYRAIAGDGPRARMSLIYRLSDKDPPTVMNMVELARRLVRKPKATKRA